jgi:FKBP-type peptidyl-prolyl cis-trans isomerase FklB
MKSLSFSLSAALLLLVTGCQTGPRIDAIPLAAEPTSQPNPNAGATINAARTAPVTTASGLRYQVLASGPAHGRSPTLADSVTVHYRGTLTDGTVFDSSYDRGEPATFGVGQVIPGWTEALQLMKPGDKWMLHIPSHLAYGSRAVGGKIPPNSDLIFQVELLQVVGGR